MYEFSSRIRYSEIDSDGKLSLESLLDYFQDCSTFHSEELGVGLEYLEGYQLAWVLASWQIVVERYPRLCEQVTIGTFPYEFKGFLGSRNFYMKDEQGVMIAKANTLWSLVNIRTMKPQSPTDLMLEKYAIEPKLEMNYEPRKIMLPKEGMQAEEIHIRQHHLDTNHHVNNGQYVRMAMGFLPEGYEIGQMRAEYKKPAFLDDVIYPYVAKQGETYWVSLRDANQAVYVNVEFRKETK